MSHTWFYTRHVPVLNATKVGLFGGTFDPPHRGHIQAAQSAKAQVGLDEVRFVVANDPWQKSSARSITKAETRLSMVQTAIDSIPGFLVDDREIRRGGPSYTADTLEQIRLEQPLAKLYLIVGQESAGSIGFSWHRPEVIFELSTLVVVTRTGAAMPTTPLPSDAIFVEMEPVDVSSSQIRTLVSRGEPIHHLTTDNVANFISTHNLYRDNT